MNYNRIVPTDLPFSEELLDKITNNILGNLFVADKNGTIIYCNDGSLETYDRSREDVFTTNCADLFPHGFIDREAATAECIRTKKKLVRFIRTAKGVGMMIHCTPVLDQDGELELVVASTYIEEAFVSFANKIDAERENLSKALSYLTNSDQNRWMVESRNQKMNKVYTMVRSIARTDSGVTLYGESGVGKEIIAKLIHKNSDRRDLVFLPVNCAAIPSDLLEAELFGYEKGAFTGANKNGKPGLFEVADKGTIFLDEVGELPLAAQAKLLRVLESGAVRRIGGDFEKKLNARVIAATNQNLKSMVEQGTFREDLYYRLNIFPIHIPPLRERPEDIIVFARFYLDFYNRKYHLNRYLTEAAKKQFTQYPWPGNIRELRNVIERLVVISEKDEMTVADTYLSFDRTPSDSEEVQEESGDPYRGPLKDVMAEFERKYIISVLKEENGNVSAAAKLLGIHRTNLYKAMKRLNIEHKP